MKRILSALLLCVSMTLLGWAAYQSGKLFGEYQAGQESYEFANQSYVTQQEAEFVPSQVPKKKEKRKLIRLRYR